MVLIQSWPPHLALAPIAQADPPLMPFRDAGYSQADFGLSVQDVVYGVWKAKEEKLCGFREFSLQEYGRPRLQLSSRLTSDRYERYERVDQGDFNWITPQFLALASPQYQPVAPIPQTSPAYASLPKTRAEVKASTKIPGPFKNVLSHFTKRNVGVVVRLNSELYSPTYFTALGINHLDMIFDDGTCPPLPMVKKFIKLSHEMINIKRKAIAVHCKAGLGRTGCLIGAYLIYRHGFTANEVIAYMRFMRPGMVVGPQQHWLHLNQGTFREWWWEDTIKEKLAKVLPSTPIKTSQPRQETFNHAQVATPPTGNQHRRHALGEIVNNGTVPTPVAVDENLPAPTPGQPRKTHRMDARHHPYARAASGTIRPDSGEGPREEQVMEVKSHRQSTDPATGSIQEEGWTTRTLSSSQRSPELLSRSETRRSVSYTTSSTTTTSATKTFAPTAEEQLELEMTSDVENWISHPPDGQDTIRPGKPVMTAHKSNGSVKSGNGSGILGVAKARGSPVRRSADSREGIRTSGVRKASGRVASVGTVSRSRS